jgi:thiamine phosphate synthase YjbQ (UPF0047 family)
MISYRKELYINIPSRRGFLNITSQVEEALRESGIREGLCLIKPKQITSKKNSVYLFHTTTVTCAGYLIGTPESYT